MCPQSTGISSVSCFWRRRRALKVVSRNWTLSGCLKIACFEAHLLSKHQPVTRREEELRKTPYETGQYRVASRNKVLSSHQVSSRGSFRSPSLSQVFACRLQKEQLQKCIHRMYKLWKVSNMTYPAEQSNVHALV